MFEAFAKLERQYVKRAETPDQELSQVAIGSIMGYFRSHPLPEEREQQIRRMIVSQRWPAREERALKVLLA
jgi:predicted Zn-dependent protease